MCGIAGIVGSGEDKGTHVRGMLGMIRHRGPDQFGIYEDPGACLGSARLSIIDLSTGQQPICNEDGSLWIVFNGEIFNFVELRPELERRGHRFRTNSDTEALLHMYEEFGADCLERLNGQFAFAIWDARKGKLFLGRDRIGIRPLFYTEVNGALLFASEIKALLRHPRVTAQLDPAVVDQVFIYWNSLPGRTVFRGIREIPPGHYLEWSGGQSKITQYWDFAYPTEPETSFRNAGKPSDYLDEFRELLVDATRIRLRADVPVGAYLSGGLDSSVIARIIATRTTNPLTTFSIAFDDPEFDESSFQLRMSRLIGGRHEVAFVTHEEIGRVFPDVIWHTETPIMRTAPAPMFLLSKLTRDSGFKVVLSGEGADEILGGYDIFKEAAVRRFWARQPESEVRWRLLWRLYPDIATLASANPVFVTAFFGSNLLETDSPCYSHLVRWRNNARTRRFFSKDVLNAIDGDTPGSDLTSWLPRCFGGWGPLQRAQYLESKLFLSGYLLSSQGDRVGMAHSIETRLPFLDYRVVEFCGRLPSTLKLQGLKDKRLLRQLGRELLPPEVWTRPKRPYRAPIHRSFFGRSRLEYVAEMLAPETLRSTGFFNAAAVGKLVERVKSGAHIGETDDMALAGILSTQLAHHHFVSRFRADRPVSETEDDLKLCGPGRATARYNARSI